MPFGSKSDSAINRILSFGARLLVGLLFLHPLVLNAAPPEELATPESIGTQVIVDSETQATPFFTGEALVALVKKMIPFDVEGSSVLFNRSSGQLFVRNTPSQLEAVDRIINELRAAGKKQVDIEARILTVSSKDFLGLGQNFFGFDITRRHRDVAFGTTNEAKTTTSTTALTGIQTSFNTGVSFPTVADADSVRGGQFSFFGTSNRINIEAAIDALESIGEVNTLAAPRLTVFNNQRANIKVEDARNYLSTINYELIGERGVTLFVAIVSAEAVVEIARSGTILDVTPTINADGTITLELHPTFVRADLSNTQTFTNRFSGADFNNSVTLPVFEKQAMDTTLTVPNGGVAVLGGLITETENLKLRKTPILSDLPFVGRWFFQNEQNEHIRSYLIMFVRATVRDAEKNIEAVNEEK
ncbi:MAG: hypothetical protein HY587_00385 [Candidatus Omnitrophica bacterium]|nr:hypothetical protein [Candidatus Omnitrophota bacterium]